LQRRTKQKRLDRKICREEQNKKEIPKVQQDNNFHFCQKQSEGNEEIAFFRNFKSEY
jgi:hypothetical protein